MKNTKKYFKINIVVASISFLICSFLTISYAALTTTLTVTGEIALKSPENIRLVGIAMTNSTNDGIENYDPLFYMEEFVTSVNLPNLNSTVTYTITLKN